jgi:hypothetical protein
MKFGSNCFESEGESFHLQSIKYYYWLKDPAIASIAFLGSHLIEIWRQQFKFVKCVWFQYPYVQAIRMYRHIQSYYEWQSGIPSCE